MGIDAEDQSAHHAEVEALLAFFFVHFHDATLADLCMSYPIVCLPLRSAKVLVRLNWENVLLV